MTNKKILVLGNVGSGKTTLIRCIRSDFNLPYISTGNIVRNLLETNPNSETAVELKYLIDNKLPFTSGLISKLLLPEIQKHIQTGFIIDGFPKNPKEADELVEIIQTLEINFDHILNLQIELPEVLRRLENRVICPPCNISGSLENQVLKKECEGCGNEMQKRKDDEAEMIRARYEYMAKSEYEVCSKLEQASHSGIEMIDCNRSPNEIYTQVKLILL